MVVGALRQAQGERNQGARVRWGVGGRGEMETAPRRAPALGSRFRGNDGVVGGSGEGCWWWWGPFDRLRANGIRERVCGGGLVGGARWRRPRAAHLPWVPAFAGTTVWLVGVGRAHGRGRGGSRLRGNDEGLG